VAKSAGKIFGIPADFPKPENPQENCLEWQNPQEKPWKYLRIYFRRKIRRK
jgi:hypothetical protein